MNTPTEPPNPTPNHPDDSTPDPGCVAAAAKTGPGTGSSLDGATVCGAKKKHGAEGGCRLPKGWGTSHPGIGSCKLHGGCMPNHVAAAERIIAERAIGRLLANPHAAPVTDPLGELARIAGMVGATVEVLSGRVNELASLTGVTDSGSEQVRAIVGLWERMIKQSESLLTTMAKLGIEDRSVRLEEARVAAVVGVLQATAGALLAGALRELAAADGERLRAVWPGLVGEVIPAQLRALGAGPDGA